MTRANIILAALRLFLMRGYKYVSLNDVAREAGITKGGIYHYFASKEELLHATVYFLFALSEEKYVEFFRRDGGLRETLRSLIVDRELDIYFEGLFGIRGDDWFSYANFVLEAMRKFPELHDRVDQSYVMVCGAVEQKIKAAAAKGEIRGDVDNGALAVMILSTIEGKNFLGASLNSLDMRERLMENIWRLIQA